MQHDLKQHKENIKLLQSISEFNILVKDGLSTTSHDNENIRVLLNMWPGEHLHAPFAANSSEVFTGVPRTTP